jgi:hypothetical protein
MCTEFRTKLWPQPIETIGLAGEYSPSKTTFGLSIDPARTRFYDTERNSDSPCTLGIERVSVHDVMRKLKPDGYGPMDLFLWWWDDLKKIEKAKFSVIMINTISDIEEGLVEWVQKNPEHFGRSPGQYSRRGGLIWDDVKSLWNSILTDLSARCQTFVFATHMANVWSGDRPTGKRKPKGKETLMELASLFLMMERKADEKNEQSSAMPAAIVLKSRLVHTTLNPDTMEPELVPCLPPRIPACTPAEIRAYLIKPPNYMNLKNDEQLPHVRISEDDRTKRALALAKAEADAERFRFLWRSKQQEILAERRECAEANADADSMAKADYHKAETVSAFTNAQSRQFSSMHPAITAVQIQKLVQLKSVLVTGGMTQDRWRAIVQGTGVQKALEMTETQAAAFIVELEARVADLTAQTELVLRELAYWQQDLAKATLIYGRERVYDATIQVLGYPPQIVVTLAEALPVLEFLKKLPALQAAA